METRSNDPLKRVSTATAAIAWAATAAAQLSTNADQAALAEAGKPAALPELATNAPPAPGVGSACGRFATLELARSEHRHRAGLPRLPGAIFRAEQPAGRRRNARNGFAGFDGRRPVVVAARRRTWTA